MGVSKLALGFLHHGFRVIGLELAAPESLSEDIRATVAALRSRIEPYGINQISLASWTAEPLRTETLPGTLPFSEAAEDHFDAAKVVGRLLERVL